jgi:hemerythrin-like domain-containing protein
LRKSNSKPADTTMMGVVHDALRRDLSRLQAALDSAPPPDGDRRMAIADHARWMMDFLDHHHHGEDAGLWPLLRQRAPQAHGLLDRMEADHARVMPAAGRLRETAATYRGDAGERARSEFRDAVSGLSQVLLPHLRGEEDEAMPLVSETLTEAEWRNWDQAYNVKGKSLARLAADGHWLMDGLDPARYSTLIHLVPARSGSPSSKAMPAGTAPSASAGGGPASRSVLQRPQAQRKKAPHSISARASVRNQFLPIAPHLWRIQ